MNIEEYLKRAKEIGLHLVIIHPRGDARKIKVIDNQFDWEVNDFRLVSKKLYSYEELEKVIKITKELAYRSGKEYIPFDSRYCRFKEEDYRFDKICEDLIEEIEREME